VHRRGVGAPADVDERIGQCRTHGVGMRPRRYQEPASGRRRERHGDLKLGVIAAARLLVGLGQPWSNTYSPREWIYVARHSAQEGAFGVLRDECIGWQPTRARTEPESSNEDRKS